MAYGSQLHGLSECVFMRVIKSQFLHYAGPKNSSKQACFLKYNWYDKIIRKSIHWTG